MTEWDSESWLREKYVGEGLSTMDIAEITPVSRDTIRRRLHEYDIELESNGKDHDGKPWADEDRLRELYVEEGLSLVDVGERLGCDRMTVSRWLERYGIERRQFSQGIKIDVDRYGYVVVHDSSCDSGKVKLHRLIMVAEHGIEPVKENVVHHENGFTWDNRPGNLMLMSHEEHMSYHHTGK